MKSTNPTNWSRHAGEQHGQRDRAAALETQTALDAERHLQAACVERWPAIVAALKSLVVSYNDGAGVEAVTLAEDTAHSGVTLEATTNGRRALVIALDGSDINVRSRSGPNRPLTDTHWVSLDRTDENAAAYLLRDWLERL